MATIFELGPGLPDVARRAIRLWLESKELLEPTNREAPPAPVFVTLRTADGSLRGCVGSVRSHHGDVVTETARSALLAANQDPRFLPVQLEELEGLNIEVSVLSGAERVDTIADLDPKIFGVIVRDASGRQGLLLPDIPGVEDVATQIAIARRKAGILQSEPIEISRFRVQKWCEGTDK